MSFLLFILLILFLLVGWPLLRGWLYLQNVKRRVNDAFGGRDRQDSSPYDEDEYTDNGDRKIYGNNEGEYAEYEEVSGTIIEETAQTGDTRTIIEEQITDAEYEEINS